MLPGIEIRKSFYHCRGHQKQIPRLGIEEQEHSLLSLIYYHNAEMKNILEWGTLKNYHTTGKYIDIFLKQKLKRSSGFRQKFFLSHYLSFYDKKIFDKNLDFSRPRLFGGLAVLIKGKCVL
jgi:hypothetical protein